jgi:hypothetical protein
MRIRELFKWVFWSTLLGELAALSTPFLPGRPRVRVPPPSQGIYRRIDLEKEFSKSPLPSKVVKLFEEAVTEHLAGRLQKARELYLDLRFLDRDSSSQVTLSEESAVVAFNLHLVYEASGPEFMQEADRYLELYQRLLDEAMG